jgi:hypothetical protein
MDSVNWDWDAIKAIAAVVTAAAAVAGVLISLARWGAFRKHLRRHLWKWVYFATLVLGASVIVLDVLGKRGIIEPLERPELWGLFTAAFFLGMGALVLWVKSWGNQPGGLPPHIFDRIEPPPIRPMTEREIEQFEQQRRKHSQLPPDGEPRRVLRSVIERAARQSSTGQQDSHDEHASDLAEGAPWTVPTSVIGRAARHASTGQQDCKDGLLPTEDCEESSVSRGDDD